MTQELDLFSNLPDEIFEQILDQLPDVWKFYATLKYRPTKNFKLHLQRFYTLRQLEEWRLKMADHWENDDFEIGDLFYLPGVLSNYPEYLPEEFDDLPVYQETVSMDFVDYEVSEVDELRLYRISPQIGQFANLQVLELIGISDDLPPEIGNLPQLRSLSIYAYHLVKLPEEIGNLKTLKELVLVDTGLQYLPESIGNLKNLDSLILNNNQLTRLPESMENLRSLRTLVLSNNQLEEFPMVILKMTSLEYLGFSCAIAWDGIKWIPPELKNRPNLRIER